MGIAAIMREEAARTIRKPSRLLKVVQPRKLHKLRNRLGPSKAGEWEAGEGALLTRRYRSYEDYVAHQRSKLGQIDLSDYEATFRPALRERLATLPNQWSGASVLCLAARGMTNPGSPTYGSAPHAGRTRFLRLFRMG